MRQQNRYWHHYAPRLNRGAEELSEEERHQVECETRVIELAWSCYTEFGEKALNLLRQQYYHQGLRCGTNLKRELGITDESLQSVVAVVEAYFNRTGLAVKYQVEGNKASYPPFRGLCPVYYAIESLGLQPEKVCPNTGWAFFKGLIQSVNPKAKMFLRSWRWKSPEGCSEGIFL